MANVLTRINNNQISSAVSGNAALGINAASKVQAYSITSTLLANSLVYGSDLTISGNLTVNGTTTAVDTVNTLIKDPILTLADGQTAGTPTVDIGMLGLRGNQNSSFMGWLESPQTFAVLLTNTVSSNTTVNATSYGNFIASNITANANLSVVGNIIGAANFSGNVTAPNFFSPGIFSATGNVIGGNVLTAGFVSATGNVTGGNLITGGLISATGNITGSNINATNGFFGNLNLTGDITVNSLSSNTFVSATGNINTANAFNGATLSLSGNVTSNLSVSQNISGNNISAAGFVSAAGNVIADNVITDNVISSGSLTLTTASNGNINIQPNGTGNIILSNTYINSVRYPVQDQDAASKIYVDNLVSTAISYHEAVLAATTTTLATTTGGTITYNQPNGAGNGIGATLTTTGSFNLIDTANVQTAGTRILVKNEANAAHNGIYVWSNATVITRSSDADTYGAGNVDALGINDYFFVQSGNVNEGSAWIVDAPSGTITFGTSNIQFAQFSQSQVYSANTQAGIDLTSQTFSAKVDNNTTAFDGGGNIIVKAGANLTTPNIGAATGTSLSVTGNVTAGNFDTAGLITATGNVTAGNFNTAGLITATGNITTAGAFNGATLSLSGNVTSALNVTGNIAGGNITTPGLISATGNLTSGNVTTAGLVTATGNVTGGNINTAGLITATGNITGANLILTNGFIDGPASGRITINGSDIDTDFAVDGDTLANVFYVDAGTGTTSFGSSTQVTNAIATFNTTTSIKVPAGTTGERPGTGVTGMVRFNTSNNNLEIFDNAAWTAVGVPVFTVISDEQFNGDGANTVFTLTNGGQTTNSCIVSINGVIQIPNLAYGVSGAGGNVLTFTEAPAVGDIIDVRQVTTTTTVTSISNSSGNAVVAVSPTANDVQITGDLVPTGNLTANLGSSTNLWNSLYVGGNTIYLGGLQLKEVSANTFGVFTSDGVTQANVDVGNIDVSSIVSGTSTIGIAAPNGNAFITVGGTANVFRATTTGVLVTGTISANGNVDGGNFRTGGLVSATGNVDGANFNTAGLVSATGNIRGANFNTAGLVSATGNVDGGNFRTGGVVSAAGAITGASLTVGGGNITAGNLLLTGAIEDSAQLDIRTTASNANIVLTPNGTGNVNISGNVMPTANATANIGSATLSFNTIFAKATSAQYADLAEKYTADAEYAPGTVVMFGGSAEVTVCANDACKRVAGVISTNPSYIMNGTLEAEHVATVALTGRVPCLVTGTVRKGDLMVSAGNGRARAEENPQVGTVIGKALTDSDGDTVIEVVVGRF